METQHKTPGTECGPVIIRPLLERDLDRADQIFRIAFGTFLSVPNPSEFAGDSNCIHTRWRADPSAALAAEVEGELVGSNLLTRWGSVGFFGPLTIHPSLWEHGIAKKLLAVTVDILDEWRVTHAGLFTFCQSTKHIALYQKFDFWPRFLTMLMSKPATESAAPVEQLSKYSGDEKAQLVQQCRRLTDAIYPGLDVAREIQAVDDQRLGDTILLVEGSRVSGFAVCHCGAGTEAGTGACYVKFAAIDSGKDAERRLKRLLRNCEAFASSSGASKVSVGVNTSHSEAYRLILDHGFRTEFQGVTMHRKNDSGYSRAGVYVLDDWR